MYYSLGLLKTLVYFSVCVCLFMCVFSHVQLFASAGTAVHQSSLSMNFPGKKIGMDFHALLQGVF